MITLTDEATSKVRELIEQEDEQDLALRVAVRPGGCSGFSYTLGFEDGRGETAVVNEDEIDVIMPAAAAAQLDE